MPDDNQSSVPASFIALFVPAGRVKPSESRAHISARYEFCEDLAEMLTEHASTKLFELGVHETDVLERMFQGLVADASVVNADEAWWVVHRLAELLAWPAPGPAVARIGPLVATRPA